MTERYKVTVEEDNDSGVVAWIILAGLAVLCFISEERTRHYEKCRFCGEIQYHDTVKEV